MYQKTVDLYSERMAEAGGKYVCVCLGVMYQDGIGINPNYSTTMEWHRKAVEQGYADAQFYIGSMYEHGKGVDRNYSN